VAVGLLIQRCGSSGAERPTNIVGGSTQNIVLIRDFCQPQTFSPEFFLRLLRFISFLRARFPALYALQAITFATSETKQSSDKSRLTLAVDFGAERVIYISVKTSQANQQKTSQRCERFGDEIGE
jgi:hypothetical protein